MDVPSQIQCNHSQPNVFSCILSRRGILSRGYFHSDKSLHVRVYCSMLDMALTSVLTQQYFMLVLVWPSFTDISKLIPYSSKITSNECSASSVFTADNRKEPFPLCAELSAWCPTLLNPLYWHSKCNASTVLQH